MSFVSDLITHTRAYESCTAFWKWAGYAAIAGTLRDNVWLPQGDSKLYPNIYVLFLAPSSGRKGNPVNTAQHLGHLVGNTRIISGRNSIQAILRDLSTTETTKDGQINKGGSAIFFAPELSAGLVQDDQSIQILTDIYDYNPVGYSTNLVGGGKFRADKLIFSMLGASNEELLKDIYTSKAIEGGLLGRTFLITPDEIRPANAFPEGDSGRYERLVNRLREVSKLEGPFDWHYDAKEFYRLWYTKFRNEATKKSDRGGVLGRLPTGVKKLAMILAADEGTIVIDQKHTEQAIDECLSIIRNYAALQISQGKSTLAACGSILLELLARTHPEYANRKHIIRDNWMHFDPDILDKTVAAFEAGGLIQCFVSKSDVGYRVTEKGLVIMGRKDE